jgi:hypothetical protein
MDIIAARHTASSEVMAKIDKSYADYFDAQTNGVDKVWDDLVKDNIALREAFDKAEVERLKAMSTIFVRLLGTEPASNVSKTNMSKADLQKGGAKLMKKAIDGFISLDKLRKEHFDSIKDLGGEARSAAQMTFWNEVWQPKVGKISADFVDDNWKTFFKVKTDYEKSIFPGVPEPEVPKAQG